MEEFKKEVRGLSTQDLMLILEDQVDLYSKEELEILKAELASRPTNALELEKMEQERREQAIEESRERARREAQERKEKILREQEAARQREAHAKKIQGLKARGYSGYYEYTTVSLLDDNGSGILSVQQVSDLLNDYSLDGWRLVTSYSNEIGYTDRDVGYRLRENSTVDQHIFILERFVKI